jgi:hypothetical protein
MVWLCTYKRKCVQFGIPIELYLHYHIQYRVTTELYISIEPPRGVSGKVVFYFRRNFKILTKYYTNFVEISMFLFFGISISMSISEFRFRFRCLLPTKYHTNFVEMFDLKSDFRFHCRCRNGNFDFGFDVDIGIPILISISESEFRFRYRNPDLGTRFQYKCRNFKAFCTEIISQKFYFNGF